MDITLYTVYIDMSLFEIWEVKSIKRFLFREVKNFWRSFDLSILLKIISAYNLLDVYIWTFRSDTSRQILFFWPIVYFDSSRKIVSVNVSWRKKEKKKKNLRIRNSTTRSRFFRVFSFFEVKKWKKLGRWRVALERSSLSLYDDFFKRFFFFSSLSFPVTIFW